MLVQALSAVRPGLHAAAPEHRPFRAGDVRHSRADVSKAQSLLGYQPSHDISQGLVEAAAWFAASLETRQAIDQHRFAAT